MIGVHMKQLFALLTGFCLLSLSLGASADTNPDALIKNAVQDVLTALKDGKSDKKKIQALVDEKVLPLFDFTLLTKRAVGPAWKTATAEQKKVLVEEFKDLLVRVFIAKAFTDTGNRVVKFEPLKFTEADDQVTVKTLIVTPGQESIAVDYDLRKTAAGWKVVDFAIAGPRLALDIYSNQFRDPLQQGGVDNLIQFLTAKNHAAETAVANVSRKADVK